MTMHSRHASGAALSPLSRRSFLLGTAGALALAACGGDDDSGDADATTDQGPTTAQRPALNLLSFAVPGAAVPGSPQRFPLSVVDADGVALFDSPPSLTFNVIDAETRAEVGGPIEVARHAEGLERGYYPLVFTPPGPAVYEINSTVDGVPVARNIQVAATSTWLQPGDSMIPVETPTTSNPQGVEFLCTAQPQCPLHDETLSSALAAGTPVALLFSTPKYCQIAICGPVLDVLLTTLAEFPTVRAIHSEIYPSDAAAQPQTAQVTPAVQTYRITGEPILFLARADGVIAQRFDTIYDAAELRAALSTVTS